MAVKYRTVVGKYLSCSTSVPSWNEVSFNLTLQDGDSSYRQVTPKRKRSKPFIQDVFRPTSHYCDSKLIVDAPFRATAKNYVDCVGSIWTPQGYVSRSAGARQRTVDVSAWSGNNIPFNGLTSYPSFNPSYNKIWDKVKAEKVNLAMMLAEYRQTASMFKDLTLELVSIYRNIRRGRFRISGNHNGPSDKWLMYRYGMTPFISDVNGISKLLTSTGAQPLFARYKAVQRYENVQRLQHAVTSNYVPNLQEVPYTLTDRIVCRDVVFVEYEQKSLIQLSQTGFLNPLALGWELIPYSFVVDWFLDIGAQLSALDALTGVKRWAGTRARVSNRSYHYPTAPWSARAKRYNRTVISTGPTLSMPRWEPSLSWKRIVDSIALGRQKLR